MHKSNQQITDLTIIEEIFVNSTICRLAMMDKGMPYILPFNYGYMDNIIYIHSNSKGKKIDLLKQNPKVCFEIEQETKIVQHEIACKWATTYRSLIGYGIISFISDFNEKKEALKIIMKHNGAISPFNFDDKNIDAIAILKLSIESVSGKQSSNWNKVHEPKIENITTERLVLKELSWSDIEDIHNLHSIPEVDEFNTLGIPTNIEDTRKLIAPAIKAQTEQKRNNYQWKIINKKNNDFLGMAGIFLSNDKYKIGEIYFKFKPCYWGKGFATETARCVINFGFDKLNLHKIEAGVAVGNQNSVKVLNKVGMTYEGLRRKILPIRGKWVDNFHYSIVEDDERK